MRNPAAGTFVKVFRLGNRMMLASAFGALCATGIGYFLNTYKLGAGLQRASYDYLTVARGTILPKDAVLIYMDEQSHEALNQRLNAPWDRAVHAQLIDRLSAAGARAIVFDIVFSDPSVTGPAADEQLAAAIKKSGRVILAADNVPIDNHTKQIKPPIDPLRDVAAGIGSAEVEADSDLIVRQHTPRGENPISSLSWAAATFVQAPVTKTEANETAQRWVNYYGPPGTVPGISYYKAIDPAQSSDDLFNGKIVFVGARVLTKFAGERKDEYRNPFSSFLTEAMQKEHSLFIAGVEIQATFFLNLWRGDSLRRLSAAGENAIILIVGLLFGFSLVQLRPTLAAMTAVIAIAIVMSGSFFPFKTRLVWFPWLIPCIQIVIALSWSIVFNSIQLYVQKRLYEQTLRLYLPPKLVKKFSKTREFLKPGAQKQTLTLLFSDIANFTSTSEGMDSDELADMMNNYFQMAVGNCIHKADGTVAKFIGDAIFAFWNAPDEQQDHALLACRAAMLFHENATQPINGRILPTRIGLHTGVANVGNFGSEDRVDYTALGDNVNLASRMEGLNKHLGTFCLMSGTTKSAIGDRMVTRALGSFQLKGFEGLVDVHELVGPVEQAESSRKWRESFAEALNNYEQRNLEFAELGFRQVLDLKPDDGPSKFYLNRISELASQALPDNWATFTILKEK